MIRSACARLRDEACGDAKGERGRGRIARKVIIAYGPDSGCIYLPRGATATHSWSYGWPYASSRLDRVELC